MGTCCTLHSYLLDYDLYRYSSPNLLAQLLEKQDDDGVMALAMKYALDTTMSDLPDLPSEGEED